MSRGSEDASPEILMAAELISSADALLVTAGAGMGVDSGLPDFRSTEGFWRNYKGQRTQESTFEKIARPSTFIENLDFAWAFYGHRQRLYRDTHPHPGFFKLLSWCKAMSAGYFAYTSNVDGHFQKAGFRPDGVFECHGNIFWLQCLKPCSGDLWIAEEPVPEDGPYPRCPNCGGPARPNVLMFSDFGYISDLADQQHTAYKSWLNQISGKSLTIIELGAGSTIPTVRQESEQVAPSYNGTLVRINPTEPNGPPGTVEIPLPALTAIEQIRAVLPEQFGKRVDDWVVG